MTSMCFKTSKRLTANEDDDDVFTGISERQPLLKDDRSSQQYTTNQQQVPLYEEHAATDNSQMKLAGDI